MAKSKENKQMLELGSKARAGRLLSNYLRAIADERTELVDIVVSPDKTERRLVSKAEAIARDMMKMALPYSLGLDEPDVDPKLKLEYRKLILERIEGKAGSGEETNDERDKIPERISEINRKRANAIATEVMGEEG